MRSPLVCGCSFYFLKAEPVLCWHKQWILAQEPRSFMGTGIPPCLEKHVSHPEGIRNTSHSRTPAPSLVPVPITLSSLPPHILPACVQHLPCVPPSALPHECILSGLSSKGHSVCPSISLSSPESQPQLTALFIIQNQLHLERQPT